MAEPLILPVSGKVATFRRLKGGDLIEAERQCQDATSVQEYTLAMLARRVLLNGVQASKLEIEDMDEDDLGMLYEGVQNFIAASRPALSQPSGVPSASD